MAQTREQLITWLTEFEINDVIHNHDNGIENIVNFFAKGGYINHSLEDLKAKKRYYETD